MTETAPNTPGIVLLDRETMMGKLSISDSTLRRRVDRGVLPKPIEVGGPYCLRWVEAEVDAAIAALPRADSERRIRGGPLPIPPDASAEAEQEPAALLPVAAAVLEERRRRPGH
jgi:predicted DNA-binding transcriptional regulator AlpA